MDVSSQLDTPAALLMRQAAQYPLTRSLVGVQELCERFGRERMSSICRYSNHDLLTMQSILWHYFECAFLENCEIYNKILARK